MDIPNFELFSTVRFDPLLRTQASNTALGSPAIAGSHGTGFYMLLLHRNRLLQATKYFGWSHATDAIQGMAGLRYFTSRLNESVEGHLDTTGPLRVKVLLSHDGQIRVEKGPTTSVSLDHLYPKNFFKWGEEITATSTPQLLAQEISQHPASSRFYILIPCPFQTFPGPHTRYKTTQRQVYDMARQKTGIRGMTELREVLLINSRDEVMEGSLTSVYFWREGRWVTPSLESGGQEGTTRKWALDHGLDFASKGSFPVKAWSEVKFAGSAMGFEGFSGECWRVIYSHRKPQGRYAFLGRLGFSLMRKRQTN